MGLGTFIGKTLLEKNYGKINFKNISKYGLGLGTFIGKTLLEKNFANIYFNNVQEKGGAEVLIKWKNKF